MRPFQRDRRGRIAFAFNPAGASLGFAVGFWGGDFLIRHAMPWLVGYLR